MDWEERAEVGDAVIKSDGTNDNMMSENMASEGMGNGEEEDGMGEMDEDDKVDGDGEVGEDDGTSGNDAACSLYNIWWCFDSFDLMFCIFYLACYAFDIS